MNSLPAASKSPRKQSKDEFSISGKCFSNTGSISIEKIEKVIKKLSTQLPNLTTVAVVEVATGTCLAHRSRARNFDSALAAVCGADMVRQQQQAMVALSIRGERLEDILIPFRKQLLLIRLAKGGQWFGCLVVKPQDTSLALAREILKSIIP